MIDDYHPLIVYSQTKTPENVTLRSRALADLGYRTFYGLCEVTPRREIEREYEGLDFIKAAFASEEADVSDQGVYHVDTTILLPYFPNTDSFPAEIQRAFLPIVRRQQEIGTKETAATILISIKENIFRLK